MILAKFDYNPRNNQAQIVLNDAYWSEKLYAEFSTPNLAKKFIKGPMRHYVPDNIYFITPTGHFNFGLAEIIGEWLKQHIDPEALQFEFSEEFLKRFKKDPDCEVENNLKFDLREYQEESVRLALKHGFGTFVLGTGAGKTFTIACIADNLLRRKGVKHVLILVPDNNLVIQFHDELLNQYGLQAKICLFYDKFNEIDETANVIIANRPLFLSRFLQYKKFFIDKVDCLIVDEAHSIKRNNKITKCIAKMHAHYKFGFTGTLAEQKEDYFKTLGLLGKVRYEKTSKSLRDEGYLTTCTIRLVDLKYPYSPARYKYREEIEQLQVEELRNKFLAKLVFGLKKNTLLLVNYLNHGFVLEELFKSLNAGDKQIYFVRGEIDAQTRDDIRKLMEQESNVICIAITKIFSTGINIKNLNNIVLAAGGKSSITVVQSIGRGLRLHPDKKQLNIFDVADLGWVYSMRHREKRLQIYAKEKIPTKPYSVTLEND